MIFDTHSHYDDGQFSEGRDTLLASMQEQGVGTIVNVSATVESCRESVELAEKYPFVYAAVGIHPNHTGDLTEEDFAGIQKLYQEKKVVAVGEIGLDYYWDDVPHEVQKKWFIRQLETAREQKLPVIIHSRDAAADTLYIMQTYAKGLEGVIHCFSYSPEVAKEYVKMGFYIGVGGVVTFKNGKKLKETVARIPLESIVLETDCPYMAPEPFRGKRNQSGYLKYVAEEIARIREITPEEVIAQTEENARRLYQL